MTEVETLPRPFDRFAPVVGAQSLQNFTELAEEVRQRFAGRVVWNVNSTAAGGGVAEMLQSLVPYARGVGVDARWMVMKGTSEFFRMTKRLHHALHGSVGDGTALDDGVREIYDGVMRENAAEMLSTVRPRDVVILHDPQTAGLASYLIEAGALVIWRCHVGHDSTNAEVESAWRFLAPYLRDVPAFVFSRHAYIPEWCDHGRSTIIAPSIDAFSAKNQDLDDPTVRAILSHVGLVAQPGGDGSPVFHREDGTPGRVDRRADLIRLGPAPDWKVPLVVQVSRWDPLKDPVGVLRGFTRLVEDGGSDAAELVLAGPNVKAVADDPEGAEVFDRVIEEWRELPHSVRQRIHLASLPMADVEENAAIVNALQRHAAIVVQKSLHEGFGLTVTEAMWKSRPVIASAVGGIQDQIDDGVEGVLLRDPTDLAAFADAVAGLLADPERARQMGARGRRRVEREFLGLTSLVKYAELILRLDERVPTPS